MIKGLKQSREILQAADIVLPFQEGYEDWQTRFKAREKERLEKEAKAETPAPPVKETPSKQPKETPSEPK